MVLVCLAAPAWAQTQQEGEMRLYIQQLEERIRQLTGENERLLYEVNQLRASLGQPPLAAGPVQTGAVTAAGAEELLSSWQSRYEREVGRSALLALALPRLGVGALLGMVTPRLTIASTADRAAGRGS